MLKYKRKVAIISITCLAYYALHHKFNNLLENHITKQLKHSTKKYTTIQFRQQYSNLINKIKAAINFFSTNDHLNG